MPIESKRKELLKDVPMNTLYFNKVTKIPILRNIF